MEDTVYIISFDEYCSKCKYSEVDEFKDPCNDCLGEPVGHNSHIPVGFKDKDES